MRYVTDEDWNKLQSFVEKRDRELQVAINNLNHTAHELEQKMKRIVAWINKIYLSNELFEG